MWRMLDGDRILTKSEWDVFAIGVDYERDQLESEMEGVLPPGLYKHRLKPYDDLGLDQRFVRIAQISRALLDPDVPCPEITEADKFAVGAIFLNVDNALNEEISDCDVYENPREAIKVRKALRILAKERPKISPETGKPLKPPKLTTSEEEPWWEIIDDFRGRFFTEADYPQQEKPVPSTLGSESMETIRAKVEALKHTVVFPKLPDPRSPHMIESRQILARLLNRPVPDNEGRFPGIHDMYHNLLIGPLSEEDLKNQLSHPWVNYVQFLQSDYDCTPETWFKMFQGRLPSEPYVIRPEDLKIPPDQELPSVCAAVQTEKGWAVRLDKQLWRGILEEDWERWEIPKTPPMIFPDEATAKATILYALAMFKERNDRRENALEKLEILAKKHTN